MTLLLFRPKKYRQGFVQKNESLDKFIIIILLYWFYADTTSNLHSCYTSLTSRHCVQSFAKFLAIFVYNQYLPLAVRHSRSPICARVREWLAERPSTIFRITFRSIYTLFALLLIYIIIYELL